MMDANNMAVVITPNIVYINESNDHATILGETELAQRLVEMLIINVNEAFELQCNATTEYDNLPLLI